VKGYVEFLARDNLAKDKKDLDQVGKLMVQERVEEDGKEDGKKGDGKKDEKRGDGKKGEGRDQVGLLDAKMLGGKRSEKQAERVGYQKREMDEN